MVLKPVVNNGINYLFLNWCNRRISEASTSSTVAEGVPFPFNQKGTKWKPQKGRFAPPWNWHHPKGQEPREIETKDLPMVALENTNNGPVGFGGNLLKGANI